MASEMKNTENLPEFNEAKALMRDKQFGAAATKLSTLLEQLVEKHGDMGDALAPLFFYYGDALLKQVESTSVVFGESVKTEKEVQKGKLDVAASPSIENENTNSSTEVAKSLEEHGEDPINANLSVDDILNDLIKEYELKNGEVPSDDVLKQWKQQLSSIDTGLDSHVPESAVNHKDIEENDKTEESEEQEEERLGGEELEETLNIAWEVLETGRVILLRVEANCKDTEDLAYIRKLLANTFLRLADHSMERGIYEESVTDYNRSVEKHRQVFAEDSFEMADVFSHLAIAHVFASSVSTAVTSRREHYFNSIRAYMNAIFALVKNRARLLGKPLTPELVLSQICYDSDDEYSGKGKSKTNLNGKCNSKSTLGPSENNSNNGEEEPPLRKSELDFLEKAKSELARMLMNVPSEDDVKADSSAETETTKLAVISIEELRMKVEDVFLVLEDREAAEAITGASAGLIEEKFDQRCNDSNNAFDEPALPTNEPATVLTTKPTMNAPRSATLSDGPETSPSPKTLEIKRKAQVSPEENDNKRSKA